MHEPRPYQPPPPDEDERLDREKDLPAPWLTEEETEPDADDSD